jgi:hypothetical protein
MVKDSLVTKTQALALRELGFKEPTPCYFWTDENSDIFSGTPENTNSIKCGVSVPTVDETIDWLRRKYNIIVYDKIEPFVDPTDQTHKTILFRFGVKRCDRTNLGWNGRMYIGETRLARNIYSLKRDAISIALKYIKNQKS